MKFLTNTCCNIPYMGHLAVTLILYGHMRIKLNFSALVSCYLLEQPFKLHKEEEFCLLVIKGRKKFVHVFRNLWGFFPWIYLDSIDSYLQDGESGNLCSMWCWLPIYYEVLHTNKIYDTSLKRNKLILLSKTWQGRQTRTDGFFYISYLWIVHKHDLALRHFSVMIYGIVYEHYKNTQMACDCIMITVLLCDTQRK